MAYTGSVKDCDGTITQNNTYWESPENTGTQPPTCTLTVNLDQQMMGHNMPICQVRYVVFNIEY